MLDGQKQLKKNGAVLLRIYSSGLTFPMPFRAERQNKVEVKFPLLVKRRIRASLEPLRDTERALTSERKHM